MRQEWMLCNTRNSLDDLLGCKNPSLRSPNLNKFRWNFEGKLGSIVALTFLVNPNPIRSPRHRRRPACVMTSPNRLASALSQGAAFFAVANCCSASISSVKGLFARPFCCTFGILTRAPSGCVFCCDVEEFATASLVFEIPGVTSCEVANTGTLICARSKCVLAILPSGCVFSCAAEELVTALLTCEVSVAAGCNRPNTGTLICARSVVSRWASLH